MVLCGGEIDIFSHHKDHCNISIFYLFFGIVFIAMSLAISILIDYCN